MAFPRVDDAQAVLSPRGEQLAIGFDAPPELGDIIPQHFAESAWLQKIALHVDDQQGALRRLEIEGIGFGCYRLRLEWGHRVTSDVSRGSNHPVMAQKKAVTPQ